MAKIETFEQLIDRARQAQQAIKDLNLTLVQEHDETELKKLDSAIEVLDTLNADAGPVPGVVTNNATPDAIAQRVDAVRPPAPPQPVKRPASPPPPARPAPARTVTPEQRVVRGAGQNLATPRAQKPVVTPSSAPTTLAEQISKGLYTRRLGKVFVSGAGQGMVLVGKLPHQDGLPEFENCIAPDDGPVDGAYGVFVKEHCVFAAILERPFDTHRWRVIEDIECPTSQHIVDAVAHMLRRPTSSIRV